MVAFVNAENDTEQRERIERRIDDAFKRAMRSAIEDGDCTPEEMVKRAMKAGYDTAGEIMNAEPGASLYALVALAGCTTKIMHATILADAL